MPGSLTKPSGRALAITRLSVLPSGLRTRSALRAIAFAAQWQAFTIPYRRFVFALTRKHARLGADVVCYAFIVVDLHHLLLAVLPAHA
jgi:hypothetical protein